MIVRNAQFQKNRGVTAYKVFGTLAMVVMFLAPFVLVGVTVMVGRIAGASSITLGILCAVAVAVSAVISYQAKGFAKAAMAIVYKDKHGVEPPWNR